MQFFCPQNLLPFSRTWIDPTSRNDVTPMPAYVVWVSIVYSPTKSLLDVQYFVVFLATAMDYYCASIEYILAHALVHSMQFDGIEKICEMCLMCIEKETSVWKTPTTQTRKLFSVLTKMMTTTKKQEKKKKKKETSTTWTANTSSFGFSRCICEWVFKNKLAMGTTHCAKGKKSRKMCIKDLGTRLDATAGVCTTENTFRCFWFSIFLSVRCRLSLAFFFKLNSVVCNERTCKSRFSSPFEVTFAPLETVAMVQHIGRMPIIRL